MSSWRDTGQMTGWQWLDIPPVWLCAMLGLVWVQAQLMPFASAPSLGLRTFAVVLAACGIALVIWAVLTFRAHRTSVVPHQVPQSLITTGPFRLSRNPIYLADVLVLAAAVIWLGTWSGLLLIVAFIYVVQTRFILVEERRLQEHFKEEFTDYAKTTRRWI